MPKFRQPARLLSSARWHYAHRIPPQSSNSLKDQSIARAMRMCAVGTLRAFFARGDRPRLLRITQTESETERRWTLCGRLAGPSVAVLRACWEHEHRPADRVRRLLDLRDVTFIDESGEELLSEMRSAGAEFVAAGVATKHLVESLDAAGSSSVTVYKSARQPGSRKHGAHPKTGETNEKPV